MQALLPCRHRRRLNDMKREEHDSVRIFARATCFSISLHVDNMLLNTEYHRTWKQASQYRIPLHLETSFSVPQKSYCVSYT